MHQNPHDIERILDLLGQRISHVWVQQKQCSLYMREFFARYEGQPGGEELPDDDPVSRVYAEFREGLPGCYGEKSFKRFLCKAANEVRGQKIYDLSTDPIHIKLFLSEAVNFYNNRTPDLKSSELPLIGYGSRVRVHALSEDRAVRIPYSDSRDPDENRDFTRLKKYLGSFLPEPRIEALVVDNVERELVTVKIIPKKCVLTLPFAVLPHELSNVTIDGNPSIASDLKKSIFRFAEACKQCYEETLSLPDLAGRNNVVFDYSGEVYVIDLNNSFVTDIYSIIHDPKKHDSLSHISQQVILSSNGETVRTVYDHTTKASEIEGKIIIPIDDKEWPAFDASLKFLFDLELFFNCWDVDLHALDKDRIEEEKSALLESDFYSPLRSTRRATLVQKLMNQFQKKQEKRV